MKNLVIFTVAVLSGCAVVQKVDNAFDCGAICDKYKACFNGDYDTGVCAARCREKSDDADFRRKADVCNACITERSCTSATFNCATSCASVVP